MLLNIFVYTLILAVLGYYCYNYLNKIKNLSADQRLIIHKQEEILNRLNYIEADLNQNVECVLRHVDACNQNNLYNKKELIDALSQDIKDFFKCFKLVLSNEDISNIQNGIIDDNRWIIKNLESKIKNLQHFTMSCTANNECMKELIKPIDITYNSMRLYEALRRNDINRLVDLIGINVKDVKNWRGVGYTTYKEIINFIDGNEYLDISDNIIDIKDKYKCEKHI